MYNASLAAAVLHLVQQPVNHDVNQKGLLTSIQLAPAGPADICKANPFGVFAKGKGAMLFPMLAVTTTESGHPHPRCLVAREFLFMQWRVKCMRVPA